MSGRKMFGENMSGGICPYGMSVSLLINPRQAPLGNNQFFGVVYTGRLSSGLRIVGRIGPGVRVSASFKKNPRRVLSYNTTRHSLRHR